MRRTCFRTAHRSPARRCRSYYYYHYYYYYYYYYYHYYHYYYHHNHYYYTTTTTTTTTLRACSAEWKLMEVFILLPGVSGRAILSRTGCGVSSYTTLGVEGGGPPAAGGVDIGVKSSGVGSSRSREIWSLGGEGGRVGGVSDGRALWPSEPSLGGAVARGAAGAPSTRPRPPATLRPPSTMGGKIPGEEVPEREGLERGEIWPELMGGDLEEMRRSAGRACTGDPRVADLIRGDRPWGDLPREDWEDVGGGTPRATAAERRASAAAVAARVRIPSVRCGDGRVR